MRRPEKQSGEVLCGRRTLLELVCYEYVAEKFLPYRLKKTRQSLSGDEDDVK